MSPGHQLYKSKPNATKNQERFRIIDFNFDFSCLLYSFLFVIKETPIPASIIKIAVELPTKRLRNCPSEDLSWNEPKQKLKFTINIPKIAYALAKSKPIILCCIFVSRLFRSRCFSLAGNVWQAGDRPALNTNRFIEVRFIFSQKNVFTKKKIGLALACCYA